MIKKLEVISTKNEDGIFFSRISSLEMVQILKLTVKLYLFDKESL